MRTYKFCKLPHTSFTDISSTQSPNLKRLPEMGIGDVNQYNVVDFCAEHYHCPSLNQHFYPESVVYWNGKIRLWGRRFLDFLSTSVGVCCSNTLKKTICGEHCNFRSNCALLTASHFRWNFIGKNSTEKFKHPAPGSVPLPRAFSNRPHSAPGPLSLNRESRLQISIWWSTTAGRIH